LEQEGLVTLGKPNGRNPGYDSDLVAFLAQNTPKKQEKRKKEKIASPLPRASLRFTRGYSYCAPTAHAEVICQVLNFKMQ